MGTHAFHAARPFRVRGRWPPTRSVAIVGTRAPSRWGEVTAAALGSAAGAAGWCVVSGLAPGIDTAAHRGALAVGAVTVAFVGTGLDRLEDPELGAAVVAGGGGLVSVLSDTDPGDATTRAGRDRFQVLASHAVVVVEASSPCGTLTTVANARSLGRPVVVLAPPAGPDTATSAAGSRDLIAAGAADLVVPAGIGPAAAWRAVTELVAGHRSAARRP